MNRRTELIYLYYITKTTIPALGFYIFEVKASSVEDFLLIL